MREGAHLVMDLAFLQERMTQPHRLPDMIENDAQLTGLYSSPSERAILKQIDALDEHCRAFIAASPLVMLATCGPGGADCSPRGGQPGFVEVATSTLLLLPDSSGNNRLDSLRNMIANPSVGMLFLVPGIHETLRVNGRATISHNAELRDRFVSNGKTPKTVIGIHVEEAFIQCSKALVRADLWNAEKQRERTSLPSLGTVLEAHTRGRVNAAEYDRDAERRVRESL